MGGKRVPVQVGFVTDAGETQHTRPTVPRHSHFRDGGHPDRVRSGSTQEAQVGRRLERWAAETGIHAFAQGEMVLFRRSAGLRG